jgi:hypothetical protein
VIRSWPAIDARWAGAGGSTASRHPKSRACLGLVLAFAGCNSLLGIGDPTVKEAGPQSTQTDGKSDASEDGVSAAETEAGRGESSIRDATLATDTSDASRTEGNDAANGGVVDAGRDAMSVDAVGSGTDSGDPSNVDAGVGCTSAPCPPLVLLAEDAGYAPGKIAQDDTYLYWTDISHQIIARTTKTTGQTFVLWQVAFTAPDGIAVDDTAVYWADRAPGVWRCPKSGCGGGPTLVAAATGSSPFHVAVDDQRVYWTEDIGMAVRSAPKDGVDAGYTTLWESRPIRPNEIETDGQKVYVTANDGRLYVMSVDGGVVTPVGVAGPTEATGIALDNNAAYWTVPNATAGSVNVAQKTSLVPAAVASSQVVPTDVASDGFNVYWVNFGTMQQDGALLTCQIASCATPTVLARGLGSPRWILIDESTVYWVQVSATPSVGSIWKMAR